MKKNTYFNLTALLAFLLPLVIYTLTLCPTVYTEDSGEFITAPYTFGIVHPPGYPLYCLLGKLFTFIPYGSIAWRVNFMSAFWAAMAGFFLFLLIYRLTRKIEISFVSSMFFVFTPTFWSQCVIAEVYSLNAFFLVVCLYVLQIWRENKKQKFLYVFSLIYGLSLSNHHFMALAGPFFILFILWNDLSILKKPLLMGGCIGLFILGLTPYLYLPITSKFNPVMDWGNPETLERWYFHVSRKLYGDVGVGRFGLGVKWQFIKAFLTEFKDQFGWLILLIGALGVPIAVKKDVKFFIMTAGIFIFNSVLLIFIQQYPPYTYRMNIMSVYYFPCYIVFSCYIAYGLDYLWGIGIKFFKENTAFKICFSCVLLILAAAQVSAHYYKNDLSKNYYVHDYVKSSMDLMDKNAVVFASGDPFVFNMIYFQQIEKYRKDITIYEHTGALSGEYLGSDFLYGSMSAMDQEARRRIVYNKIIRENYGKRPIYFTDYFDLGADSGYTLAPFGLVYRVFKKGEKAKFDFDPMSRIHVRNLSGPKIYLDRDIEDFLAYCWELLGVYYNSIGDDKNAGYYYTLIYERGRSDSIISAGIYFLKKEDFKSAFKCFKKALSLDRYNYLAYFGLALAYDCEDNKKPALENYLIFRANFPEPTGVHKEYVKMADERIKKLKKELGR